MSIDSIPAESLLQIFSHLPFKDLVRVGGVNRLFNQLSREAIDHLKSLDLSDDLAKYSFRSQPFWKLLDSCSPELERLKAVQFCTKDIFEILPEFSFPNLAHLEFAVANLRDTDYFRTVSNCFDKLITRNRNIRSIILHLAYAPKFPIDMIFDRLENLEIYAGIDNQNFMDAVYEDHGVAVICFLSIIQSLTGRVPNLKRLAMQTCEENGEQPVDVSDMHSTLNQFVASVPNLRSLHLVSGYKALISGVIDDFSHMWRLSSLVELRLDFYDDDVPYPGFKSYDQAVLNKISTSFPRLQTFVTHGIRNGDDALLALRDLKHLRKICLPNLVTDTSIFIEILESLPSLQWLEIRRLNSDSSIKNFLGVLTSFALTNKRIVIKINWLYVFRRDVERTEMILQEIINRNGGTTIEIKNIQIHAVQIRRRQKN